jgi:hypothetical protein
MPRIAIKETIRKEIEIPFDSLCDIVDTLTAKERVRLIERLKAKPVKLTAFKKDKIHSVLSDFAKTNLYKKEFLKDLAEGLSKSSVYR